MQDTIILGNGTSKQIKTASLPNSYAEFKAMAESGNLFADIKLNADGCEVVGTPLNKQNLLTDETAEKIGNPENIDKAIENLHSTINGIPVDLTGIYNTQVIGFDETQGKLVPMTSSTVATQTIVPSGEVPRIWTVTNDFGFTSIDTNNRPEIITTDKECPTVYTSLLNVTFNKPFLLSEYTKMSYGGGYFASGLTYGDTYTKVIIEFSKQPDFSNIEMCWQSVEQVNKYYPWGSNGDSLSITTLKGFYYIRINLMVKGLVSGKRFLPNTYIPLYSLTVS